MEQKKTGRGHISQLSDESKNECKDRQQTPQTLMMKCGKSQTESSEESNLIQFINGQVLNAGIYEGDQKEIDDVEIFKIHWIGYANWYLQIQN